MRGIELGVRLSLVLGMALTQACSANSDTSPSVGGASGRAGSSSGGSSSGAGGGSSSGGSSSGAGGGSSSGGSNGTSGAGGAGGDECGCVEQTLSWNQDGGFVAYRETSRLESCHTFTHTRDPIQTDPPSEICTDPMESCDGTVDPGVIQAALAHPDVMAALDGAPVLFGVDARAVDGQVLQVHVGDALIEIGYDCNGAASCTEIPPGISTLRTHLQMLTTQLLDRAPCSDVF